LLPIVSLLGCLIGFKLSVPKAGAVSLAAALIVAFGFFGLTAFGLLVASLKALWLALFVSLIVWGALLLYHAMDDFGAVGVINKNISALAGDRFFAFVLLSWLFTGLLQGIAGFGVPAVIVAPILTALGYDPVKSLAAALLGHSWAITFGSMGTAFFVIQGITGIPETELGVPMWIFNTCAHLMTGAGVCWLYGGLDGLKKAPAYILPVSAAMAAAQYFTIRFGMYSLAAINASLAGLAVMFALYRLRAKDGRFGGFYKDKLNLFQALLPYALILALLLLFQFVPAGVRDAVAAAPDFPATETAEGYIVGAELGYNKIRLFSHPGFALFAGVAAACAVYRRAGVWDPGVFRGAAKKTLKKGVPATLALLALGNMSLVMMDSGMMYRLAKAAAEAAGRAYPLISPFIGVLASFLTGNNTNSNVMFGMFQYETAKELGVSGAVMAAAQSISAAVGCAIGPTLILMGAIATKQEGKESLILKKLLPCVLIIAFVMGIINFVLLN